MRAIYQILDCCGKCAESIEIELPADVLDPSDYAAESEALKITGYDGHGKCSGCGSPKYRARYAGYPIPATVGVDMTIEGENRDALIGAITMVLGLLMKAPEYVSLVVCNDEGGRIE